MKPITLNSNASQRLEDLSIIKNKAVSNLVRTESK